MVQENVQFKMINGMDIIAKVASATDESQTDLVEMAGLMLPPVFTIHNPRVVVLREIPPTKDADGKLIPAHVKVALAPIDLEEAADSGEVTMQRSTIMLAHKVREGTGLLTTYLRSISGDAPKLETKVKPAPNAALGGKVYTAG